MVSSIFKNKILCLVGVFFVIPSLFWFWPFKTNSSTKHYFKTSLEGKHTGTTENAEIIIKDLILKEIEKQKNLEVIINAGEGKILNATDKIECKNITCSLKKQNLKVADLHADNAIIQKNTKNVLLSGATVGHIYDMTIHGCDVKFTHATQTLSTNKESKYSHKNFTLSAKKSLVDIKKNKIIMSNGVSSEIVNSVPLNSSTRNRN
jgi:hypothetical protein